MDLSTSTKLRIGEWCVDPAAGQISRNGDTARLEARTMRLLLCLAEHAGEVVSIDDLLNQVWAGVIVTPDSVYQAVASLRRLLGDDPKQPAFIATVPRLGYRMVATVGPWTDCAAPHEPSAQTEPAKQKFSGPIAAAGVLFILVLAAALAAVLVHRRSARNALPVATAATIPLRSVAVLPFLDLTPGMQEEEFADGITEELIDKLSRI